VRTEFSGQRVRTLPMHTASASAIHGSRLLRQSSLPGILPQRLQTPLVRDHVGFASDLGCDRADPFAFRDFSSQRAIRSMKAILSSFVNVPIFSSLETSQSLKPLLFKVCEFSPYLVFFFLGGSDVLFSHRTRWKEDSHRLGTCLFSDACACSRTPRLSGRGVGRAGNRMVQ
jgi:hypothetical protein